MFKQLKHRLAALPWTVFPEAFLLTLITLSILWKGGKTLELTWALAGVAGFLTLLPWIRCLLGLDAEKQEGQCSPVLLIALAGFVLFTLLSYVNSETGNYGLDEVLRTTALGLIFVWFVSQRDLPSIFRRYGTLEDSVIVTVALSTLALCAIGIAIYVLQPVNRFVGTFVDPRFHTDYWPNACAEFLLLAWPLVILRLRHRLNALAVPLSIVFGCLLLTYSRGALLAFGLQCACLLLLYVRSHGITRPAWSKVRAPLTRIVCITILSVAVFSAVNHLRGRLSPVQSVTEKITLSASEGSSSITERLDFFSHAWSLFLDSPLLGHGPYSFRFVQTSFQEGILETSDHPHNVILKLLSERGVLATTGLLVLLALVLLPAVKRCWIEKQILGRDSLLLIAVLGLLAHNMIDYNLQFVGIALPFWLILALLTSHQKHRFAGAVWVTKTSIATLLLLAALYEGVFLTTSSIGRHAEARGELDRALYWYNLSTPGLFARDLHLSRAGILINKDLDAALHAVDTYNDTNAKDFRSWKRRGEILMLKEDYSAALGSLEEAYRRGRFNDLAIIRLLSETLLAAYDKEVLETRMDEFSQLLFLYIDAIERNTHYIALSTNVEELILYTKFLIPLYRDFAPMYEVYAAKADHNAKMERSRLLSRPPGFLW